MRHSTIVRSALSIFLLGLGAATSLRCTGAKPDDSETTTDRSGALSSNAEISWRPLGRTDGASIGGGGLAAIASGRGREIASSNWGQGATWFELYAQTGGYLQIKLEATASTGSPGTSTPAADSTSAAVASADGGTTTEIFWRTAAQSVGTIAYNGTSFINMPAPPLGTFRAGVGAAGTTNRIDLFGVGTDHTLWHAARQGASWSGWTNELGAPPNLTLASVQPAVVWRPDGVLHVFALATDGSVWTQRYQNGWSGWVSLGGPSFGSGVAVALTGTKRLDVFAIGNWDGMIYRKYTTDGGDTWVIPAGAWESLGKPAQGVSLAAIDGATRYEAPTAVSWAGGELDVYVRDTSGAIQTATLAPSNDCQKVADEFGITPDNNWGFAPLEIQQWWTKTGCTATMLTSTNLCQKLSDIYGTTAYVTWGYAPASVQSWWSAHGCTTSPRVSESLCQRASDTYGIYANFSSGTAPAYIVSWFASNGCATNARGISACQKAADLYGINAFQSWGFAPADVQSFWNGNNCNAIAPTSNSSTAQVCQNAANLYAMSAGSPGGAPADVQAWFNANCATSVAPTCQGLSETFGARDGITWGYAGWPANPVPTYIQTWWIQNNCHTWPEFTNDVCQRASNTFGITGQTSGFAPDFVQSWWSASGCATSPLLELLLPAAKPFSPAVANNNCFFSPATMVPTKLGTFVMANTSNATVVNDVALGTFPAGTTLILGFAGLGNPAVSGDTYLRLIDSAQGEVASNDDACGTYGSRIVYTVPRGSATLSARVGCYQNEGCAGSLFLWSRLDSNGYTTDIRNAFLGISGGVPGNADGDALSSSFGTDGLTSGAYTDCLAFDKCKSHFQGVARLPIPGLGNVLALAGSDQGDLFLMKDFGVSPNPTGSWHDHWSGLPNSSQSKFIFHQSFVENTPQDGFMPHISGISAIGQYLATVTQAPDDVDSSLNPINGNGSSVNRIFRINQDPITHALGMDVRVRWQADQNSSAKFGACAAATKTPDGGYLFAVGDNSSTLVDFYRLDPDEMTTTWNTAGGQILRGYTDIESTAWPYAAKATMHLNNLNPNPFGGFQNCNLFSQADGTVWLGTTKGDAPGWAELGRVDTNTYEIATDVAPIKKTFPNGVDLNDSAGLFQDATLDRIYLYTTSKYTADGALNYMEFGSRVPLSEHQPTAQSSTAPGGDSGFANDRNFNTASSTLVQSNPWWYVDLGSPKHVQQVRVVRRTDNLSAPVSFTVWGATTLGVWRQLQDVNGGSGPYSFTPRGPGMVDVFYNPFKSDGTSTTYRYVRIMQTSTPASALQLTEALVFGN